jgi:hypothetical protein
VSEITTHRTALEKFLTFPTRLNKKRNNKFQNEKVFEVEIISEIKFYGSDPDDPESIKFEGLDGASITRALCKGRILNENMPCYNFLDKPENTTIASDVKKNNILISLHPTILFSSIESMPPDLKEGSVILARAHSGGKNNSFDLQFLDFVQLKIDNSNPAEPRPTPPREAFKNAEPIPPPPPVKELSENVHVIYWFAGQPSEQYGADFVNQKIEELGLNERDDQLIIVGEFDEYLPNLENQAAAIVAQNGSNIVRESVGAWSGGATGLGYYLKEISSTDVFDKVVLADPAPYQDLNNNVSKFAGNVSMSYNLLWWNRTYGDMSFPPDTWNPLLTALGDSAVHQVRYDNLVVEDSSGLNNISVEAHVRILEDQLRFITGG